MDRRWWNFRLIQNGVSPGLPPSTPNLAIESRSSGWTLPQIRWAATRARVAADVRRRTFACFVSSTIRLVPSSATSSRRLCRREWADPSRAGAVSRCAPRPMRENLDPDPAPPGSAVPPGGTTSFLDELRESESPHAGNWELVELVPPRMRPLKRPGSPALSPDVVGPGGVVNRRSGLLLQDHGVCLTCLGLHPVGDFPFWMTELTAFVRLPSPGPPSLP